MAGQLLYAGDLGLVFKETSKCLKQVLKMEFHSSCINTNQYKDSASAAPIFTNPTCAQQHYMQTISCTEFHPDQTIHVESRDKILIMPSLKCLTAHIFKKVTITKHCFVGNFLY